MSLQKKVLELKLNAAMAARHAAFWQHAIDTQGEAKATAFYKHLGLNHLEEKTFEWEGLKLSRPPRATELKALRGVANAQDTAKEQIGTILLSLRTQLISDGLKGIKPLAPTDFHTLTLRASPEIRSRLRDRLIKVHRLGRVLLATELGRKQDVSDDEFDELDELTDVTDARVANDVQSRIISAATRFTLLGLTGAALLGAIQKEIEAGSVSYIDRAAGGLGNKVISLGREDEMRRRSDEISRYEYSAILDQNTCTPCGAADGQEAASPDELPPTPNPECEGGDLCRCFIIAIAE